MKPTRVPPAKTVSASTKENDEFFHDYHHDPNSPFSQDPLADYERNYAAQINLFVDNALKRKFDLTQILLGTLHQRLIQTRKNYIVTIKGPPGYGKSAAAMGLYKLIRDLQYNTGKLNEKDHGPRYNKVHVIFTEEDLKNAKISHGDTLIVDEDFRFSYGIGLASLNDFVDFLNQTIRYEQVNIIYVGPDDWQSIAHLRLEMIDYNTITKESRLLVRANRSWVGAEFIGNVRYEGFMIPGYLERKEEFTNKVLNDKVRTHNSGLGNMLDALIERLPTFLDLTQKAQKGVIREAYPQFSEKQIEGVLDMAIGRKATGGKAIGPIDGRPGAPKLQQPPKTTRQAFTPGAKTPTPPTPKKKPRRKANKPPASD